MEKISCLPLSAPGKGGGLHGLRAALLRLSAAFFRARGHRHPRAEGDEHLRQRPPDAAPADHQAFAVAQRPFLRAHGREERALGGEGGVAAQKRLVRRQIKSIKALKARKRRGGAEKDQARAGAQMGEQLPKAKGPFRQFALHGAVEQHPVRVRRRREGRVRNAFEGAPFQPRRARVQPSGAQKTREMGVAPVAAGDENIHKTATFPMRHPMPGGGAGCALYSGGVFLI